MEPFYDSDEGIGAGPMSLREAKAFLKEQNFINPRKTRRESAYGRLEQPNVSNSTEYFTAADSSAQAKNVATSSADSSMEDTNRSINDAVDEVIRTLDNESADKIVIELSDDEEIHEESGVINISSSSSSSILEEVLEQRPSMPKFKINSPTSNLREPKTLSTNNSLSDTPVKLSDTQLLEQLSTLYLSPKGSSTIHADESFLLRSISERGGTSADDEEENDVESVEYCTAGDTNQSELSDNEKELIGNENCNAEVVISPSTSNSDIFNDHRKEYIELDDRAKQPDFLDVNSFGTSSSGICEEKNRERQDKENVIDLEESMLEIVEPSETSEALNSTLDRIDFILNSGGQTESWKFETPKRVVPVPIIVPKSVPALLPFKIPTKIPCSLRKELRNRSRFENIKSPVAHYIKNSGTAPVMQNQPCGELSHNQFVVEIEIAPAKVLIQWPKITLPEKCYNRGEVQVVPGYKSKILKLPANIEALTIDLGGIKRHLRLQGTSRLPVPQYLSDVDLHGTLITEALPREDVSLITEEKVIIN